MTRSRKQKSCRDPELDLLDRWVVREGESGVRMDLTDGRGDRGLSDVQEHIL